MTRKLLLLACFIFIILSGSAQVSILWQNRYSSSGSFPDKALDLVVDSKGNVYVTGIGRGVSGSFDFVTIKYDSTGVQLWKAEYNGTGNGLDQANAITIDTGFVYVTGASNGGASGIDYATAKYNIHTGALVWVSRYTGAVANGTDEAVDIVVDNLGNVYVTGTSDSPTINKPNNTAATTVKYNSAGVQQIDIRYEGAGAGLDAAHAIQVEPLTGTFYVCGSADVASFPSFNVNYLILKYNTAGALQWSRFYNGPDTKFDEARAMAIDALGNVYVTGYSENAVVTNTDIATLKFNTAGVQQWVQRYNGTGNDYDRGNAIKLDGVGNVLVTGKSKGLGSADDIITLKYNNGGVQKWVARFDNGGVNPADEGKALAIDAYGNVYVTGFSSINANNNYATLKYDSLGVQKWVTHYNGTGNNSDIAAAIAVDNGGNVFITGYSRGAGSFEDYETIKYCQLTADAGLDTAICIGASAQLQASAVGAISYSWAPNNGSLTSTTTPNPVATPTVTTTYVVTITNATGCVDWDTIVVTVSQYPNTTIASDGPTSFCIGDSVILSADSTMANYQWSSSVNDTLQSITVNTSGIYSVVLTNSTGCTSTGTITVTVHNPNVILSAASDTICLNSSTNLSASGALSYVWHPGTTLNDSTVAGPIATPTVTTTYSVVGNTNGCVDSDSITIVVLPLPVVPSVVQGGGFTLTCVGSYFQYQWYYSGSPISGANNQVYNYTQNGSYYVEVTDSMGCSVVSNTVVVSDIIGVEEIGSVAKLNVYPNPASTNVYVDLEILEANDIQIVFSSMSGQHIYKEQIKQYIGNYKKDLNIQEYSSGIYYLQIMVGDNVITKKIVKQ